MLVAGGILTKKGVNYQKFVKTLKIEKLFDTEDGDTLLPGDVGQNGEGKRDEVVAPGIALEWHDPSAKFGGHTTASYGPFILKKEKRKSNQIL